MEVTKKEIKNVNLAGLLSLVPGCGQFYNQQVIKGFAFMAVFILFIIEMIQFGTGALLNLITLGSVPMQDHSLFMMIQGSLQILIILIFLVFYVFNIYDARRVAQYWNSGLAVNQTLKDLLQNIYKKGFPYLLIVPAYVAMIFAIIFPVLVTIFMAFSDYSIMNMPPAKLLNWVGMANFANIFTLSTFRDAFLSVLSWTIIWTICATSLQIVIGVFTAIIANQPFIKGKRLFGVIFLLPWAVPAFITILSFSNMFNDSLGAINTQVIPFLNQLIPFFDIGRIAWKTDPFWTKLAIIMIQGWLGFPYIYVMTTSILQAIPEDLYEAAKIDGAGSGRRFKDITLPTILAVAAPVFLTQYTGNFNNFSMIYLFNNGGPGSAGGGAGQTDILISWIFKLTTNTSPQYSLASALTLIVSFVVIGISLIIFKRTNAFKMEGE